MPKSPSVQLSFPGRGPHPARALLAPFSGLALLANVAGCELGDNVQGLAEALANPPLLNVEAPGYLVAPGHYRGLSFDGNTTDGAYVVSVQDGKSLSIVRFPDGEGCNAGPVKNFSASLVRNDAALDARIPMVAPGTNDDLDTLRFVNFECKADKLTIKSSDLPLSQDFTKTPGFIVQTHDAKVLFVDPWNGKQQVIASVASPISRNDLVYFAEGTGGALWMWTIEEGELVGRNNSLKEVFRAGKNVESLLHFGTNAPILALQDTERALFTVVPSDPSSLKQIATDACGVQFNVGQYGVELLYYSPCAERSLHVHELDTGVVRDIRAAILDYKVTGSTETGPVLLYEVAPEREGASPSFWARWGQNEPIRLGDKGHLGLSRITKEGQARIVVDWDGSAGTLLFGALGESLKTVASSVAYNSTAGVISNFDGANGLLQRFTPDDKLEMIAERVSPRGIRNDNVRDRALFLREFNGSEGHLVLIEGNEIRSMSTRVRPNSYQFTGQENRVTLLSDLDPETNTATLKLPSAEFDDEGIISSGVAESLEVDWPSPGLLYSAPAADKPGIYFAKFY